MGGTGAWGQGQDWLAHCVQCAGCGLDGGASQRRGQDRGRMGFWGGRDGGGAGMQRALAQLGRGAVPVASSSEACRCWGALAASQPASKRGASQPASPAQPRLGQPDTLRRVCASGRARRRRWEGEARGQKSQSPWVRGKTGYEGTSTCLELDPKGGGHVDMSGYGSPVNPLAQKLWMPQADPVSGRNQTRADPSDEGLTTAC